MLSVVLKRALECLGAGATDPEAGELSPPPDARVKAPLCEGD